MPISVNLPEFQTEVTIPDMTDAEAQAFVSQKVLPRLRAEREAQGYQAEAADIMRRAGKWMFMEDVARETQAQAAVPFQTLRNMGRWGEAAALDLVQNWREGVPPWRYEWKNLGAFWQGGLEQKDDLPTIKELKERSPGLGATAVAAAVESVETLPLLYFGGAGMKAATSLGDAMLTQARRFGPLIAGAAVAENPSEPGKALVAGAAGAVIPGASGRGALALEKLAARAFPAMGEGAIKALGTLGSQAAVDAVAMASQSPELLDLYRTDPTAFKHAVVGLIAGNAVWELPRLKGAVSYGMREAMAEKAYDLYVKSPEYKRQIDEVATTMLDPNFGGVEANPYEVARMGIRTGETQWLDVQTDPVLDVPNHVKQKWENQRQALGLIADEARGVALAEAKGDATQAMIHRANMADLQLDVTGREPGQERNAEYWMQWRGREAETEQLRSELGLSKRPLVEEAIAEGRIRLAEPEPTPDEASVRAGRVTWNRTAEEMIPPVPERTRVAMKGGESSGKEVQAKEEAVGTIQTPSIRFGVETLLNEARARGTIGLQESLDIREGKTAWPTDKLGDEQQFVQAATQSQIRFLEDEIKTHLARAGQPVQPEQLEAVRQASSNKAEYINKLEQGLAEIKSSGLAMAAAARPGFLASAAPKKAAPNPALEPPAELAPLLPNFPTKLSEYTGFKDVGVLYDWTVPQLEQFGTFLGGLYNEHVAQVRRDFRAKNPEATLTEVVNAGHENPVANALRSDVQAVTNVKFAKERAVPGGRSPISDVPPEDAGTLYANPVGKLLRSGVVQPLRASVLATGAPIRWFFEEIPDRLARLGGVEAGRVATLAREAISRGKGVLGEFARFIDSALRDGGRLDDFTRWANDIVVDPKNPKAGFGNTLRLDPDYAARFAGTSIPAEFRAQMGRLGIANDAIGQMAGRGIPGFTPTGRWQRVMTPQFVDVLRQGVNSPAWQNLVEALSKIPENGMTRQQAEKWALDFKKDLDDAAVLANQRTISQEHVRKIKVMPSQIKAPGVVPGTETWLPLIEAKPYEYLTRAAHTVAARVGVLQTFGGSQNLGVWRNRVAAEGPHTAEAFDALVRALHGMPQDRPWHWVTPGTRAASLVHAVHRVFSNVVNPLALTMAAIPNTAELFAGATPWSFGWKAYLEAATKLVGKGGFYQELEDLGAITRSIHNFSSDPNARLNSALRQFRQGISRGSLNNFLNEAQEALAAGTAKVLMDRATSGRLSEGEVRRVRALSEVMGFNPTEAAWLADGTASQELRNSFIRRAAPALTSGAKAPAEQSAFMGSRVATFMLPFQSYATARMNLLHRIAKVAKAGDSGAENLLARALFGTAAQGAMSVVLSTLATGGAAKLAVRLNEAEDSPVGFILDALVNAIGGPYSTLFYNLQGGGGLADSLNTDSLTVRLLYPGQKADEIIGLATGGARGTSAYKNKNFWERASTFMQRAVPVSKVVRSVTLASGLVKGGNDQLELEAATGGYWNWYTSKYGKPGKDTETPTARQQEARTQMRQFLDGLKRGEINKEELVEAIKANKRGRAGFADSLRYKKMLYYVTGENKGKPLTNADRVELKNRIGEKAFGALQGWDAVVEGIASAVE